MTKGCPILVNQRYNNSMFQKALFLVLLLTATVGTPKGWAGDYTSPSSVVGSDDGGVTGGFAKPYEYERQAYGYDPEGVQYKENQAEDFQVVFVTSLPFTTGASFLLTSTVSLLATNNFGVGGDFFLPFLAGAFVGSTTIACVSTLTNHYPPPNSFADVESSGESRPLAFKLPLLMAKF